MVQWEHKDGETVMHKMGYNSGQLLIEKTGYYYLYTKVALNAKEDCPHFHRVMKRTRAYGDPIELMKSKRLVSALITHFLCAYLVATTYVVTLQCI